MTGAVRRIDHIHGTPTMVYDEVIPVDLSRQLFLIGNHAPPPAARHFPTFSIRSRGA